MNKQEAIEKIKNIDTLNINDKIAGQQVDMVIKNQVLGIVSHIDEPQKVVVPKFVADFYESIKDDFEDKVYDLCLQFNRDNGELSSEFDGWFDCGKNEPIQTLVKMKLYGYDVEKEKLYTVEIPNPNKTTEPIMYLSRDEEGKIFLNNWFLLVGQNWKKHPHAHLTEAEIKRDFEWAWQFAKQVEDK